jgi:hypothetical protein
MKIKPVIFGSAVLLSLLLPTLAQAADVPIVPSPASDVRVSLTTDTEGYLYNDAGEIVGQVDREGYIYDAAGTALGLVDTEGYVYDATGATLGRVDEGGYAYDVEGNKISNDVVTVEEAAAFFFF